MESKILSAIGIDPAFILLFLFLLIIVLFVLNVSVTMKYNRLKSSYNTFMKGKDGKTLEESMKEKYAEVDTVLKVVKQNRLDIREINRRMEKSYQKLGIESMTLSMKWAENSVLQLLCLTTGIMDGSSMRCTAEKVATHM